jgi:hypothetical protein
MAEAKVRRIFICGLFDDMPGRRPGLRQIRVEVRRGM